MSFRYSLLLFLTAYILDRVIGHRELLILRIKKKSYANLVKSTKWWVSQDYNDVDFEKTLSEFSYVKYTI